MLQDRHSEKYSISEKSRKIPDGPPFNEPAKLSTVENLYKEGLLSCQAYREARNLLKTPSSWYRWTDRLLLYLGTTLILAGVVFFFAYNWDSMGRFMKFGLVEVSIIILVILSLKAGLENIRAKIALISASLLTGVLLAVFGQTYQTGADNYELFNSWAILITGFVIAGDFAPLWVLLLAVIDLDLLTWWIQVGRPVCNFNYQVLCQLLTVFHLLALFIRELALKRGFVWLNGSWLRFTLLMPALVASSIPAIDFAASFGERMENSSPGYFVIWLIVTAGIFLSYRYILPDMIPVSLSVMSWCLIFLTFAGNLIFSRPGTHNSAGELLFFSILVMTVTGAASSWLLRMTRRIKEESGTAGKG